MNEFKQKSSPVLEKLSIKKKKASFVMKVMRYQTHENPKTRPPIIYMYDPPTQSTPPLQTPKQYQDNRKPLTRSHVATCNGNPQAQSWHSQHPNA